MRITIVLTVVSAIFAVLCLPGGGSGVHPQVGPSLSTRMAFGAMLVTDVFLVGYTISALRSEMNKGP